MNSYENDKNNNAQWTAGICRDRKTDKITLFANVGDKVNFERLYKYDYQILEMVKVKNVSALNYFTYWNKIPIRESKNKFDFFKYVLGADFTNLDYKKQFESEKK